MEVKCGLMRAEWEIGMYRDKDGVRDRVGSESVSDAMQQNRL